MKAKTKFSDANASNRRKLSDANASNRRILHKPHCLVKNVIVKKLLDLKLRGSEKFPALRKKYFSRLKYLLTKEEKDKEEKENQLLGIVFTHFKRSSSIRCILPELISFITSELKTVLILKPTVILKALYCLFLNDDILVGSNVSFNIMCTSSLKNFLANSLKCCDLGYLLKDIAADILCEFACIFLSGTSKKLPSCNFHRLQIAHEDLYGATVAWLSSMTPETAAKCVHREALHSERFLRRALNFPKMCARLVSVCESHVYCCMPTQIANVSVNETHSLYNLKLVNQFFYNLMRHEAVFTPVFYMMYDPRPSKPFQFSDLLFEVNLMELLESSPCRGLKRDMPDGCCRPPPKKKLKRSPKNFYTSQPLSSLTEIQSLCKYRDLLFYLTFDSNQQRYYTDSQLINFGNFCPLWYRIFYIYRWETSSICHLSTSSSDSNPFNSKLDPFEC